MNEDKKLKKQRKADAKAAKQNPLGKNSKYNGGYKNIAKYSKEGRDHMKLFKSANKNWRSEQSIYFKKVDYSNTPISMDVSCKKIIVPVNPEYATRGNPNGWYSKNKDNKLKSQKYLDKKEKAENKMIRKIVKDIIDNIIINILSEFGHTPPLSVLNPVTEIIPKWKERKMNQKKEMAINKEIKKNQQIKRALKKERRVLKVDNNNLNTIKN